MPATWFGLLAADGAAGVADPVVWAGRPDVEPPDSAAVWLATLIKDSPPNGQGRTVTSLRQGRKSEDGMGDIDGANCDRTCRGHLIRPVKAYLPRARSWPAGGPTGRFAVAQGFGGTACRVDTG